MRQIANVDSFKFDIIQRSRYCVPASIQAVSNYLEPELPITQERVMEKYQSHGGTLDNIGLESIKREVLDKEPEFKWSESEYLAASRFPDFTSLATRIKASIDNSIPHIVSTKIPIRINWSSFTLSPWHMLTVVGYDEDTSFEVYNPEPIHGLGSRSVIKTEQLKEWLLLAHRESEVTDSLVIRRKLESRDPKALAHKAGDTFSK